MYQNQNLVHIVSVKTSCNLKNLQHLYIKFSHLFYVSIQEHEFLVRKYAIILLTASIMKCVVDKYNF